MLLYLVRGRLPWQGITASSTKAKHDAIMQLKISTPIETLCAGIPSEFSVYLNYCRGL